MRGAMRFLCFLNVFSLSIILCSWVALMSLHGTRAFQQVETSTMELDYARSLRHHLIEQGAELDALEGRESNFGGRGVFASRSIAKDEMVFRLPKTLLIRSNQVCEDPFFVRAQLCKGREQTDGHILLAYFLLYHEWLGSKSPHHLYIATLPSRVPINALTLTIEDIGLLNGTYSHDPLVEFRRHFLLACKASVDWLDEWKKGDHGDVVIPDSFTDEEKVTWAFSITISRSWGSKNDVIMAPFIDFINTKPETPVIMGMSNPNDTYIYIPATRDIAAGEEIFLQYFDPSIRTVQESVATYGFLERSLSTPVFFSLQINESDPLRLIKVQKLNETNCLERILFREVPELGVSKFVQCARIGCARAADAGSLVLTPFPLDPINMDNELCAVRMVLKSMQNVLDAFPQNIAEDRRILREDPLSIRQRVLVELRMWEKKVFINAIDILRNYWNAYI